MATSIDAVRLLDSQTYETLDRLELEADEKAMSVCSVSFENDPEPYYVVGTAHAVSTESEPTSGRIIVFAVRDRRLHQVAARDTKATVFVVQPFQVCWHAKCRWVVWYCCHAIDAQHPCFPFFCC